MRTTLTLEDDVAVQIQRLQKEKGLGWKAMVNEALRLGLVQMEQRKNRPVQSPPTLPRKLGRCSLSVVSVSEALALAEGEDFRLILVDANLLLYAYYEEYAENLAARQWLDGVLLNEPRVGLPWPSLLAFIRLSTNPRIFSQPASTGEAWAQVNQWLDCPSAWIPQATDGHRFFLDRCLTAVSSSNLVPDAHLAALALEHGLTLCSADHGFARFPGLRCANPLRK